MYLSVEVEAIVNSFSCVIHVLILTEVWLRREECSSYNLQNYNSIYSVREKEGAIFIHKSLIYEVVKEIATSGNNLLLIKINNVLNKNIQIGAIYKPPNTSASEFLNDYDNFLESANDAIVFGDYNIDLLKKCNLTDSYNNIVNSNGYKLLNKIDRENCTRPASNSILDHVSTSLFNLKYEFGMQPNSLSDHNFISLSINLKTENNPSELIEKINYKKVNESIQRDFKNKEFFCFTELFNSVKKIIQSKIQQLPKQV